MTVTLVRTIRNDVQIYENLTGKTSLKTNKKYGKINVNDNENEHLKRRG